MFREDESLRFIPGRESQESQPEADGIDEAEGGNLRSMQWWKKLQAPLPPEDVISSKFKKFVREFACHRSITKLDQFKNC